MAEKSKSLKSKRREKNGRDVFWDHYLYLRKRDDFVDDVKLIRKKFKSNYSLTIRKDKPSKYLINLEKLAFKYELDPVENITLLRSEVENEKISEEDLVRPNFFSNLMRTDDLTEIISDKGLGYLAKTFPVVLLISPYASKNNIIQYVLKNYKNYIEPLKNKYRDPNSMIGRIRKRNSKKSEIDNLIYKLRKQGVSSKDILTYLREKGLAKTSWTYPDIDKRYSEESKRRKVHRT